MFQKDQLPSRAALHLPRLGQGQPGGVPRRGHVAAEEQSIGWRHWSCRLSYKSGTTVKLVLSHPWAAGPHRRGVDGVHPRKDRAPVARVSGRPLSMAGVCSGEAGTTHPCASPLLCLCSIGMTKAMHIHMHTGLHTLTRAWASSFWSCSKLLQLYTLNSNRTS